MARAARRPARVPRVTDLVIANDALAPAVTRGLEAWIGACGLTLHPGTRAEMLGHIVASIRRASSTPAAREPDEQTHWWNRD